MRLIRGLFATMLVLSIPAAGGLPAAMAAEGQITWAVHVSLAPTWFDPAETSGIITPYMMMYAMHDAMVKPMPGNPMTPAWPSPGPPRPTGWSTSSSSAGGSGSTTAIR